MRYAGDDALPRHMTVGRVVAALLLVGLVAGFLALWSGFLAAQPGPAPVPRIEVPLPPPAKAAAMPAPSAAPTPAPAETAQTDKPDTSPIATLPTLPAPPPPDRSTAQSLLPAPDPALVEKGTQGPLPIIGRDGRQPWRAYARPFDLADKRPRIAILITGLGPSGATTETAINELPGGITLAFDPYTRQLSNWVELARAAGHEALLALPMEPTDYPRQDPGPYTLLTSLSAKDNVERLDWVLSRVTGYVGVVNLMGSRFTMSETNLAPVFDELKKRGLIFVDSRASPQSVAGAVAQSMGLPRAISDETLDAEPSREVIDHELGEIEQKARQNGAALGTGFAYPVTLERVALWAKTLESKGFALAPVTAVATASQTGAAK